MKSSKNNKSGVCYLAGSGPGDMGLVTVRAKELIKKADVIIHDQLINQNILHWAGDQCEIINVGKKAGKHKFTQDNINDLIVEKTQLGGVVLRLKGGDPFIFGRVREEIDALLEAHLEFKLVPGVSAASAVSAYAGITITDRELNSSLIIYTGHEANDKVDKDFEDLKWIANASGTKTIYMGLKNLKIILERMLENGADRKTPIAVISNGTYNDQKSVCGDFETIEDLVKNSNISSPALIVIGEVVKKKFQYDFNSGVLSGKRIVVTRSRKQASVLSDKLNDLGAEVIEYPVIKTVHPSGEDAEVFNELVEDTHTYDWIVFSSPNGVESFFEKFYQIYRDARSIGGARIAAVGPGTAKKILSYRVGVDVIPKQDFTAESLADAMINYRSVENLMILWVRGKQSSRIIFDRLSGAGAIVDEAIVYETVKEDERNLFAKEKIEDGGVDMITFASSLTAHYFFKGDVKLKKGTKIASIGPITSKTLKNMGHAPDLESEFSNIDDFVLKIADYFQSDKVR